MGEEFKQLSEKLDILTTNVGRIDDGCAAINTRLRKLEDQQKAHGKGDISEPQAQLNHLDTVPDVNVAQGAEGGGSNQNPLINFNIEDYTHVQQEFGVIKDSLQRVRLPNELKVNDSNTGIQRADQQRHKVVSKCARYAETLVKLLSSVNVDNITQGDIQDLITVCVAQLRFLQEEQSMMLVNNNFGPSVERLYRTLRNNSAQFSTESLATLQAAVALGGQAQNSQGGRQQGNRGQGYRNSRGGYNNGGWRGQNRGRVPPSRSQDQTNQAQGTDNQ